MKSNKAVVLIVEDDAPIAHVLSTILTANEYSVLKAPTGAMARSMISSYHPDVILLDLGLPDMSGLDVLQWLRRDYGTPVLIVSARADEQEKVQALDMGADDYITKPFGTSELLARIRTALRHQAKRESGEDLPKKSYSVGGLTIDFERRQIILNGEQIHVTQTEYKIIELIARRPGRVLTYDYIIRRIWGDYAADNNRILRVNMAHIRRKLEENPAEPKYIMTEIGVGYRMAEETGN